MIKLCESSCRGVRFGVLFVNVCFYNNVSVVKNAEYVESEELSDLDINIAFMGVGEVYE